MESSGDSGEEWKRGGAEAKEAGKGGDIGGGKTGKMR